MSAATGDQTFSLDIGLINLYIIFVTVQDMYIVPAFGVTRPQRQAEHPKSS